MRILAISGSLRSGSSNTTLLQAAAALAPQGVEMDFYGGWANLPAFNPDLDTVLDDPRLPAAVREWREQVAVADALLISTPEYAHGVPGALKNALDWLVGGSELPGKPVALLNASVAAEYAQRSLAETLRTMSAELVPGSPFSAPVQKGMDRSSVAADPRVATALAEAWLALGRAVESSSADASIPYISTPI